MSCKFLVGAGPTLDFALAAWRERDPALDLRAVTVDPDAGREVLAAALDALALSGASAFVAVDGRHLSFRRLALVELLRERGVPMPALVARGALVAQDAGIGENVWIGPGAIVQHGCVIGPNAVIGAGAIVGAGAHLDGSCWIEDGVVVGRHATVGSHVALGLGVTVGAGVRIADYCVIDRAGRIEQDVASRTFLHASHDGPIVIAGQ